LLPTLIVHALEKRWPPLVTPEIGRDFVYVEDAIDALIAVAQKPPGDPARFIISVPVSRLPSAN